MELWRTFRINKCVGPRVRGTQLEAFVEALAKGKFEPIVVGDTAGFDQVDLTESGVGTTGTAAIDGAAIGMSSDSKI